VALVAAVCDLFVVDPGVSIRDASRRVRACRADVRLIAEALRGGDPVDRAELARTVAGRREAFARRVYNSRRRSS
jgi:hypothetical protein